MGRRTVVVSKPSKLDLRLGYMVVRDCESTVRVHISEILLIENRKTFDSIENEKIYIIDDDMCEIVDN